MRIRTLRMESGKPQTEVAQAVGVNIRVYVRWEAGETRPDAGNLVALLDYFRATLDRPEIQARDLLDIPDAAVSVDPT